MSDGVTTVLQLLRKSLVGSVILHGMQATAASSCHMLSDFSLYSCLCGSSGESVPNTRYNRELRFLTHSHFKVRVVALIHRFLGWLMGQISLGGIVLNILCVTCLHMLDGDVDGAHSLNICHRGNCSQLPCLPWECTKGSSKGSLHCRSGSFSYILLPPSTWGILWIYECFKEGWAGPGLM
jgi:hypothetical protein